MTLRAYFLLGSSSLPVVVAQPDRKNRPPKGYLALVRFERRRDSSAEQKYGRIKSPVAMTRSRTYLSLQLHILEPQFVHTL